MKVAGILHTGLTVSDLDRSVAFYRDLLGLELVAQWDSAQPYLRTIVGYPDAELRIALLRLPGGRAGATGHLIELLEYRAPRGVRGDAGTYNPGNAHVAFIVDDLDGAYADLRAKGVRFKSAPVEVAHGRNRGARAVYFFDPDDITLELVQPARPPSRPREGTSVMPAEKLYCGNCGSPLYYGRKFKEHTLGRPCVRCRALNPTYFHYCYRCGEKILAPEEGSEDETA